METCECERPAAATARSASSRACTQPPRQEWASEDTRESSRVFGRVGVRLGQGHGPHRLIEGKLPARPE